jgi:lipopolysaccharide transport system permease protein
MKNALQDLLQGLLAYQLWMFMSWQEVRQRYHRSLLGPLWITISMGIFIVAIGPIYSKLLNQSMSGFFRSLSIGYVVWTFIAGCIGDSCSVFIAAEGFIKQVNLPCSLYIFKLLARNAIIFFHNLIIIGIVLVIFPPESFLYYWYAIFGFISIYINLFWICLLIGMLCTRYRDVAQLVGNAMQLIFFITPIMWPITALSGNNNVINYNFFYYCIDSIRAPLSGSLVNHNTWLILTFTIIFLGIICLYFFSKYRSKIIYWI